MVLANRVKKFQFQLEIYHGACPQAGEDDKVSTKSLVTAFNRPSTKQSFQFFCNSCITKIEINMASSESDRLNVLETNMSAITAELTEIKNLLKKSAKPVGIHTMFDNNIWFNKDKLVSTKVAPAESILVVNKSQRLNNDSVEKAIVDNAIPVTKSYNNTSADLVIVCDTPDSRDKLKDIISSTTENIQMKFITREKTFNYHCGAQQKVQKRGSCQSNRFTESICEAFLYSKQHK